MENNLIRNTRRTLTGLVVSDKMDKSITVRVSTYKKHPLYAKRIKVSKTYLVHDEKNIANEGDHVRIMETRPLSKHKHFRLLEIKTVSKNPTKAKTGNTASTKTKTEKKVKKTLTKKK